MEYPEKFKEGFIKKIEKELSKCEIIYNDNTESIWFINREKKYWYLEYVCETNVLFWRPTFFNLYINIFSIDDETFKSVISKWVEDVLNCKVLSTKSTSLHKRIWVGETLNCKVLSTSPMLNPPEGTVEETLKCDVQSIEKNNASNWFTVEETLKCEVLSTCKLERINSNVIDETLNYEVKSVIKYYSDSIDEIDDILLK